MFGTSFYGLIDTCYCNQYKNIVKKCVKYDMNDFIHLDCAYDGPAPTHIAPDAAEAAAVVRRARRRPSSSDIYPSHDQSENAGPPSPVDTHMADPETERGEAQEDPLRPSSPPATASEDPEEQDLFEVDPFGSNVGVDLASLHDDGAGPSRDPYVSSSPSNSHDSPVAMDHDLQIYDEVVASRIPSTPIESPAVEPSVTPLSAGTTPTTVEDFPVILLSDSSDDEGRADRLRAPFERLVERGFEEANDAEGDFFANAAGEAPAPGESVKFEPGGDYFNYILNKRLRAQKERQDILDALEASKQKQAEMEAAFAKQKEDAALEKERMAAAIRAETMAEMVKMKAEMAQLLSQASLSHSVPSAPSQSEAPQSSAYPRIEDKSMSESPASRPQPSALLQCSNADPLVESSSLDLQQPSSGALPEVPRVPEDPSSSTGGPMEYPRPEDRSPPPAVPTSPVGDLVEAIVEVEEAGLLDRVEYASSPEAHGQRKSEDDKVG